MAELIQHYGTGRRKSSTARVFMRPGKGNIMINKRPLDEYFGRETACMLVRQPFETVEDQAEADAGFRDGQRGHDQSGIDERQRLLDQRFLGAQAREEFEEAEPEEDYPEGAFEEADSVGGHPARHLLVDGVEVFADQFVLQFAHRGLSVGRRVRFVQ